VRGPTGHGRCGSWATASWPSLMARVRRANAALLLDGNPMSGQKDLWRFPAPASAAKIWSARHHNISFDQPLLDEEWTLTCLPDSLPDGSKIHFKVAGSSDGG